MPLFKNKESKKRLERWFGRQWFNLVAFLTRFLTLGRAKTFGRILGKMAFYLVVRHRRAALRNIQLIYGKEKSKQELREMIRRTFIRASCFGWEALYLYSRDLTGAYAEDLVKKVEGIEQLEKAVARGKGVIGLGAHLGNFLLLGRKLTSLGFPNTAIMRQMKDGKLEDMLVEMRSKFGQRCIPKLPVSRAIEESIAWLREGKVLILYMDQRAGRGVKVDFMGIPTFTPTGAAVFALKTGAAVLPIVNVQDQNGFYKLIIGEEMTVTKTGDQKKDIMENTLRFNQAIEKYIRLFPDQWFWFHNRWKGER
ncbi:MAG: lysophospholipid acyltransferase family protein [Candidatus Omnitrophica bacterium]|nr:lysophospholipid acyltransferase family protein [Candidatus Omnitrophota bacterium]